MVFGLDQPPNFEGEAWHLTVRHPLEEAARMMEMPEGAIQALVDSARVKLLAARDKRVRPGRDEKVLTSWNALMVGGMARAARAFERPDWLASARRALDFMRATLWNDGRLLATSKDGRAHLDAYLDDHAYLLAALLEMLQAEFRAADLAWAQELGDILLERFLDREAGGFFFTAHDHEKLIQRPKPGPDNATPSGNAVAAWALSRLSFLTGETRYSEAAAGTVALFWPQAERQPAGFGTLLAAIEEQLEPPRTVIVMGARDGFGPWPGCSTRRSRRHARYSPAGTVGLPPVLASPPRHGSTPGCAKALPVCPRGLAEELRETLDCPESRLPITQRPQDPR